MQIAKFHATVALLFIQLSSKMRQTKMLVISQRFGDFLGAWLGWRHFVDSDISWTLFFKVGDFSWTFSKGDFSWTLLVTSRGHFLMVITKHYWSANAGGAGAKPLLG